MNAKIRIFDSMVQPVLLYGAETWRTTVTAMKKTQSFINTCLRRVTGRTPSVTWSCGSKQDSSLLRNRSSEDAGGGLAIPFASLHPALQDTPSFGIHKEKGREAGQETAGAVTWMQMSRGLAIHGDSLRNRPRTGMTGEPLFLDYAQNWGRRHK